MTGQVIEEPRNAIPNGTSSGFNAYFWADKGGLLDVYNTMYRRPNTFSHGAMGALSAYVEMDERGRPTGIG